MFILLPVERVHHEFKTLRTQYSWHGLKTSDYSTVLRGREERLPVYVAARRRVVNVATPECGVYCICRRWKGQRAGSLSPTTPTRQCVKAPYHPRGGDTDKLITLINWLTQLIRTAVCFTLSSFCMNRNICLINQNTI